MSLLGSLSRLRERAWVRVLFFFFSLVLYPERPEDHCKHPIHVGQHVVVPEAQHAKALLFQPGGSPRIALFAVLPAVDLDDELGRKAGSRSLLRRDPASIGF
jgi:hypothetical protein